MFIKNAKYVSSATNYKQGPKEELSEFAFIGRSNVGKSSLINALTNRRDLARVSKKPGKTQTINYYLVNESWFLVDLPGYGYAQHSKKTRSKWQKMIEDYLQFAPRLTCVFLLIDFNIPPQDIDISFMNWLGEYQIPFVIVYTKVDKTKKQQREGQQSQFNETWATYWDPVPEQFFTSAVSNLGLDGIYSFIDGIQNQ